MNRRSRRKGITEIKLTPEGWVFLVVLGFITVGAVLRNVNLLIVMAGMMYAPLLLNWRFGVRRLRSLWATRRLPNQVHANELTSVQWTCENRMAGVAAWNVVINDKIERAPESEQSLNPTDSEEGRNGENLIGRYFSEIFRRLRRKSKNAPLPEAKLSFVRVNAGQSEVQAYRAFFGQRGKYKLGPANLSTTFPFGLIVSRTYLLKTQTVFVAPEIGQLEPTWEKRIQSTAVGSDAIKRRRALEEDEFYALRPWRSGDNKKNIHWRTTARYGQPIVKQYDQQNNRDFALLLDLHAADGDAVSIAHGETVLSFAATVALQIRHAVQGQVAVGVCGRETQIYQSRSPLGIISGVMRALSVASTSDQPQTDESLLELFAYVSKGTPIYVASTRPRPDYLDPNQLDSLHTQSHGDREAERLARRIRHVLPMIRWLHVESEEFRKMYSAAEDPVRDENIKRLTTTWAPNAKR